MVWLSVFIIAWSVKTYITNIHRKSLEGHPNSFYKAIRYSGIRD